MVNCRICKGKLVKIVNLGKISLVGNFLRKFKKQKKYKISLNFCVNCKHVQIAEILNPNLLFKKYLWETGVSKSNIKLIEDIIKKLKPEFKYLKLKSANIDYNKSNYIFWYDLDEKKTDSFLKNIKNVCDENLEISIYSKTGAYE